MKRFRFPLHPVAVLRAHHEMKAREDLAAATRALAVSEENLRQVRHRISAFEASIYTSRSGKFSAATEAQNLAAYRTECAAEDAAERALASTKTALEARRTAYLEAHRKLEVVRRLESKARGAHRLGVNRAEQAEFDEYAGRAHAPVSLFRI